MVSLFVDTSALVKYYYPEHDSEKVEKLLLGAERIYVSSLTIVEMASAFWKKVRMGELERGAQVLLWNTFLDDMDCDRMELVFIDERHYYKAADLIKTFGDRYGLKTLDSLHLAVAYDLDDVQFLCADKTLSALARKMGMKLLI